MQYSKRIIKCITSFCSIALWQFVKSVYQRLSLSVRCSMFVSCSSDWIASLTLVYFVLVVEVGVGGSGRLLTVILLLNRSVYKEEEKKNEKIYKLVWYLYTKLYFTPWWRNATHNALFSVICFDTQRKKIPFLVTMIFFFRKLEITLNLLNTLRKHDKLVCCEYYVDSA